MYGQAATIPKSVTAIIDTEGSVLLDLGAGRYYSINGIGAYIWAHLEQGFTSEEIVNVIVKKYDANAERVREDVNQFISTLADRGLIVWN